MIWVILLGTSNAFVFMRRDFFPHLTLKKKFTNNCGELSLIDNSFLSNERGSNRNEWTNNLKASDKVLFSTVAKFVKKSKSERKFEFLVIVASDPVINYFTEILDPDLRNSIIGTISKDILEYTFSELEQETNRVISSYLSQYKISSIY